MSSDAGSAFSNGFEYDEWRANWCDRCVKDTDGDCEVLYLPLCENRVPPQWTDGTDDLRDRYHCAEFQEEQ